MSEEKKLADETLEEVTGGVGYDEAKKFYNEYCRQYYGICRNANRCPADGNVVKIYNMYVDPDTHLNRGICDHFLQYDLRR